MGACSNGGGGPGSDLSPAGSPDSASSDLSAAVSVTVEGPHEPIAIIGDEPRNGIFDPSVEYGPDGSGWLAYSAVYGERRPFGPYVETHIAKSVDKGATWEYAKTVNLAHDESFVAENGKTIEGNWNYEVSSLVFDATDPGREWKLFSHRTYADPASARLTLPQYSWISFRYTSAAETPAGEWSAEQALLGAGPTPLAPFDDRPRIQINGIDPDLNSHLAYSEPGTLVVDGTLYLSLSGLAENGSQAIVLLASDDHTQGFRYVGKLVTRDDAAALGYDALDGSSLVSVAGQPYLFSGAQAGGEYSGTFIFEIADIATARLDRDGQGQPIVTAFLPPDPSIWEDGIHNAGESDYDEGNEAGGVIFPQADLRSAPRIFGFYNTGYRLGDQ